MPKTSWSQKGWCNKPTQLSFQLILIRKVVKKLKIVVRKCQKQAEAEKRWCNKPTQLPFQLILIRKILMLSKRYESTEVDHRTWLHWKSPDPDSMVHVPGFYSGCASFKYGRSLYRGPLRIFSKVLNTCTCISLCAFSAYRHIVQK